MLRGDLQKIADFKKALTTLPVTMAAEVASKSAPGLTTRTQGAYDGGQTVYGDTRPQGEHGPLDLRQSGATRADMRFVAYGRIVRCVLGPRWAKYLIGKYEILPNGRIPAGWSEYLRGLVAAQRIKP